jgi:hypothetical protein
LAVAAAELAHTSILVSSLRTRPKVLISGRIVQRNQNGERASGYTLNRRGVMNGRKGELRRFYLKRSKNG